MTSAIKADRLWSLRKELHDRFDGVLGARVVDTVLDGVTAEKSNVVGIFRRVIIERAAVDALATMAAGEAPEAYGSVYPLPLSVLGAAA
ncbi:hypothetical protein [Corynebacterium caspium]|nr:hypothetical protein [Corynebacterium caspium]WKD59990.1 hypothetical protein CCASP_08075 [Corynebacterium caspium DSM 44850]